MHRSTSLPWLRAALLALFCRGLRLLSSYEQEKNALWTFRVSCLSASDTAPSRQLIFTCFSDPGIAYLAQESPADRPSPDAKKAQEDIPITADLPSIAAACLTSSKCCSSTDYITVRSMKSKLYGDMFQSVHVSVCMHPQNHHLELCVNQGGCGHV